MSDAKPEPPTPNDPAEVLRARLRRDLASAMGAKASPEMTLLRGLIAAIDNAQAPAIGDQHEHYEVRLFGDRSAEVPRVLLTEAQLRTLLEREIGTRREAAAQFERLGKMDEAAALRAEAEVASRYLLPISPS